MEMELVAMNRRGGCCSARKRKKGVGATDRSIQSGTSSRDGLVAIDGRRWCCGVLLGKQKQMRQVSARGGATANGSRNRGIQLEPSRGAVSTRESGTEYIDNS